MLTGVASAGYEHDELTRYVDYYNKHVESVPEFLNPIIGDQTINVHILTGDEIDLVFGMRTDGMSVAEFSNEPRGPWYGCVHQTVADRSSACTGPGIDQGENQAGACSGGFWSRGTSRSIQ